MRRLSHRAETRDAAPVERIEALTRASRRLRRAKLHYGHGTDNPGDDAAALLAAALKLAQPLQSRDLKGFLSASAQRRFDALLQRRIKERMPVVYLTRRCWFAGLPMYVDERVLIPRSPIAELIEARFSPWAKPEAVQRILDVGTGSGCIAIACALAFPKARVDAVDISAEALAVARINRRLHSLSRRVRLLKSSYFTALKGRRYDIIVSNPPYVGAAEIRTLPPEYRHEPVDTALASGRDGLNAVRVLLRDAPRHLTAEGILVVEVGNSEARIRRAFPELPFLWLSFERGGGGVFLLTAAQLQVAGTERG
jgi:ribosomal protein L3 glutamine methyltransferase